MTNTIDTVQIIPLGGLDEFGMNMMALGYEDQYILIDCGKKFPEDKHLGVEAIIPDFSFVEANHENISGLFLTHGHEDHIGAVSYLLRDFDIPVYATPLTIGMVRNRLKEFRLHNSARLNIVERGGQVDLGKMLVQFIGVSHGIPDSCSIAVTTPAGTVIHTGDFKIDQTPLDNQTFDFHTFAEYGKEGVLLLMSDSTNVERAGYTYSEREVYEGFLKIFNETKGKILIASFASHLHRMQQIIDLAITHNRKVAFCGRSVEQNSRLAKDLGYLDIPSDVELSQKEVKNHPAGNVVVIASGSQAEPNSALAKIATDNHPHIKLKEDDTVALSARKIPGNGKAIAGIINHLYRRGAKVYHDGTLDIHVSGHGFRDELKMMMNLVKPKFFMPIHGEYRQLRMHADMARKVGIPEENILMATRGDIVEVSDLEIYISGQVHTGHVMVDSSEIEEMDQEAIYDRRILAQEGVVAPIVTLEISNKPRVLNLYYLTKALSSDDETGEVLESAKQSLIDMIEECSAEECRDEDLMKAKIGKSIRKLLMRKLKVRPMILPVIIEV